jgi:hypothetical protein
MVFGKIKKMQGSVFFIYFGPGIGIKAQTYYAGGGHVGYMFRREGVGYFGYGRIMAH